MYYYRCTVACCWVMERRNTMRKDQKIQGGKISFIKARKETGMVVSVESETLGCIKLILRSKFKHIPNKFLL